LPKAKKDKKVITMHDIKKIRNNPEEFDAKLARRGVAAQAAKIIELDEFIREKQTNLQELQTKRNDIARAVGQAKSKGEDASQHMQEAEHIKEQIPMLEGQVNEAQLELHDILVCLPNEMADDTPEGEDEDHNREVRTHGKKPQFDFKAKQHFELGEDLGMMDFETAAKMSGSRFVLLKKQLARLERALANFMLDVHTQEFGYEEVAPPVLLREHALFGTGQLPKFAEDFFKTTDNYVLAPTAEVPLTNIVADQIIAEEELPLRFTAHSNCFRSEAGSAGRDTRGMIRLHQFSKVELVSITNEKDSHEELERMTTAAETILQKLELPYRLMQLCAGDIGFSAHKTYDLEVWLPGQKKYREISSCSNCLDFQARRMKTRYKELNTRKNKFVHTLNGSGLAVGRTIVAILENYQNADGTIAVPQVLRQYLGGLEIIGK
jgi:seryl-tRNA synthetase